MTEGGTMTAPKPSIAEEARERLAVAEETARRARAVFEHQRGIVRSVKSARRAARRGVLLRRTGARHALTVANAALPRAVTEFRAAREEHWAASAELGAAGRAMVVEQVGYDPRDTPCV